MTAASLTFAVCPAGLDHLARGSLCLFSNHCISPRRVLGVLESPPGTETPTKREPDGEGWAAEREALRTILGHSLHVALLGEVVREWIRPLAVTRERPVAGSVQWGLSLRGAVDPTERGTRAPGRERGHARLGVLTVPTRGKEWVSPS